MSDADVPGLRIFGDFDKIEGGNRDELKNKKFTISDDFPVCSLTRWNVAAIFHIKKHIYSFVNIGTPKGKLGYSHSDKKPRLISCLLVIQFAIDLARYINEDFEEREEYKLKYLLSGFVFLLSTHCMVAATSPISLLK
jgi:hypothetical protein